MLTLRVGLQSFQGKIEIDFKGIFTHEKFTYQFKIKDFGISDNKFTMKSKEYWCIEKFSITCELLNIYQGFFYFIGIIKTYEIGINFGWNLLKILM
jgi:hypothetical protein